MKIQFSKYHGTGNDFVIIDNRLLRWKPTVREVADICDRHFGIGADGLMLLSARSGFDFVMTYFNSDGKESTMCGNGGRCITAFAKSLGLIDQKACFWAVDGMHEAEINENQILDTYRLRMKDTRIENIFDDGIFLDTGSPHFVTYVEDAACTDVFGLGRQLRNDARFAPGGANVNFVQVQTEGLFVRSYERGVENETLSCGTGVTASALAHAVKHPANNGFCNIKTLGGMLHVTYLQSGDKFTDIWLEGAATFVFRGEITI